MGRLIVLLTGFAIGAGVAVLLSARGDLQRSNPAGGGNPAHARMGGLPDA